MTGQAVGEEFSVYNIDTGGDPSVASLDGGKFVVTWTEASTPFVPPTTHGQIFDNTGSEVFTEFAVDLSQIPSPQSSTQA